MPKTGGGSQLASSNLAAAPPTWPPSQKWMPTGRCGEEANCQGGHGKKRRANKEAVDEKKWAVKEAIAEQR